MVFNFLYKEERYVMTPSKLFKFIAILEMCCLMYFSHHHNVAWMVASGIFALLAIILIDL
jgi:hypothetical protein